MTNKPSLSVFIPLRLDGMNAIIGAARHNRYASAAQKREQDDGIAWVLRANRIGELRGRYSWHFTWHEPNRRRDPDNIESADKFIFDALQKVGILDNDGWSRVAETHHYFKRDPDRVGVEVRAYEVSE